MAISSSSSLPLALICFLVLFHGGFAAKHWIRQVTDPQGQPQQRSQSECQIQSLNAVEPQRRVESEGGVTEFWDQNEDQFQCAGVAAVRHQINRRGLLLPSFQNAPKLFYVVQGRGIHGAVFPGCPETFESETQSGRGSQRQNDRHQKVRQIKEGDILALPEGVIHWVYNNGESKLVLVTLLDVGNANNQLDQTYRRFFLGGNPEEEVVSREQSQSQGESSRRERHQESERQSRRGERQEESERQSRRGEREEESERQSRRGKREEESERQSRRGEREEESENSGNSILSGFSERLLAEIFNIDNELARKLQNQNDERGAIVRVQEELHGLIPQSQEEEQEEQEQGGRRSRSNGIEETFCSMKLRHRTADPSQADVFNPRAGRLTSINSFNFPILQYLQLSAERGFLYRNAIYAPHWNINAHSIVYIVRGNGRIQIVGESGNSVFHDRVQEGQMLVVPQNFAVVKRAGDQGLEWISFKTNANARVSQIAGRNSVIRSLPLGVVANAFDISPEEAQRLKQSRREASVFGPLERSRRDVH